MLPTLPLTRDGLYAILFVPPKNQMFQKFAVLVCTAAAVCGTVVGAQQPTALFKASVAAVPISAVVRDSRGRTVTTLKMTDFEVRDNGEPTPILTFGIDETMPLTIAVLVDTSGSMRLDSKLAAARQVVNDLSVTLRDGIDTIGVFTFDAALHELHAFTERPASVETALSDAAPFGATSLYDAIAETARRLDGRLTGRRAIIVVTDGVDTHSALAPAEVSARASAIDAPVYIVATAPKIDQTSYIERTASPNARSTADAQDLALWTGGTLLWASSASDAAIASRQILTEIRHQYLIAVDSAGDGVWRRLDVRVRDSRLTVRARSGYFGRDTAPGR
jgi:Ca-activated chloride channel family protein